MSPKDFISDDILRELKDSLRPDEPVEQVAEPISYTQPAPAATLHPIDVWARTARQKVIAPQKSAWAFFSLVPWIIGAGAVIISLLYVSQYGIHLKARVTQQGNAAITNLLAAKDSLENLDFGSAQNDFTRAYEQFGKARDELGLIGSSLGTLLAKLPGGGQIRSAQNLIDAGQLISDAGASLAKAVGAISGSGSILDSKSTVATSLEQILSPMRDALQNAHGNIIKATTLLAGVDPSVLPDGARAQFTSFTDQLPKVQTLIGQGNDAVNFLSRLMGDDQPRRYLLLFQNSSELRPTGGFPGSYGLVTFENGRVRDITTDDIYNPDGQIKQLVVPPLQLQGITPSWGMRDANWFIDFPTSAQKVAEFYRKGGGTAVDGVIALRPEIISNLLRITGPISMPAYNLVISADNFIPTVQLEVESQTTAHPKQVIVDLAPLLIAKLSSLPPAQWAQVLNVLKQGLVQRDVMMYMDDTQLQHYIVTQGWDGGVHQTDSDYLTVNMSNVKGAKGDAVTDTSVKLESWLQSGTMAHRLTITRQNNGGHSEFGFYNKTNYSYVRVLVPDGSTLTGITGNDRPSIQPMVDYSHADVVRDPDLVKLESTYQYNAATGATTSEESGKTGFGFWMKIAPGQTQSVQLQYTIPARAAASDYHLYVQRQPGLDLSDFEFTLQKDGLVGIGNAQPALTEWPDSWRLHDPLKQDLDLAIGLK